MAAQYAFACKQADLAPGEKKAVEIGGHHYCIYNLNGIYYATDDVCTHGLSSLATGEIVGEEIECAAHFGTFNIITGKVTAPPCSIPLKTWRVELRGADVFVET